MEKGVDDFVTTVLNLKLKKRDGLEKQGRVQKLSKLP
jgi:hypothetical protein